MNRDEIHAATEHELRKHLVENLGVHDHHFEKNIHYHSARLRQMAKDTPLEIVDPDPLDPKAEPQRYEFFSDVADHLDSLHAQFHEHGHGRIVVWDHEKLKQVLLDHAEGKLCVHGHRLVPK
jgi:hypothetical protein